MKSVLKGLTFAVLTVSFGLSMVPSASACGSCSHSAVIDNGFNVLSQPAVIGGSTILSQPGYLGSGCGTCSTLVQPAVIDNGCNSCGGSYGGTWSGSALLTQPAIYGGPSFYGPEFGYGLRRRFSPWRGWWY